MGSAPGMQLPLLHMARLTLVVFLVCAQNRMTVQHCWYDSELHDVPAPRNGVDLAEMMANKEEKGG